MSSGRGFGVFFKHILCRAAPLEALSDPMSDERGQREDAVGERCLISKALDTPISKAPVPSMFPSFRAWHPIPVACHLFRWADVPEIDYPRAVIDSMTRVALFLAELLVDDLYCAALRSCVSDP